MASEDVLWLDCTTGQQLCCSVPQDGKARRAKHESLGGKQQCHFCLRDVIIASLHARAWHNACSPFGLQGPRDNGMIVPVALSLAPLILSNLLDTGSDC